MLWSLVIFRGHKAGEPAPVLCNYAGHLVLQVSVMTRRVSSFILRAHTGVGVSHGQHIENREKKYFGKMQVNGPKG